MITSRSSTATDAVRRAAITIHTDLCKCVCARVANQPQPAEPWQRYTWGPRECYSPFRGKCTGRADGGSRTTRATCRPSGRGKGEQQNGIGNEYDFHDWDYGAIFFIFIVPGWKKKFLLHKSKSLTQHIAIIKKKNQRLACPQSYHPGPKLRLVYPGGMEEFWHLINQ